MAFDVGAGLAQMGETTSKVAGASLLETQKAELEKQKIVLADELAGKRQDKQNEFTAGESEKHRGFLGAEGEANRKNSLEGHRIAAAASAASAGAHLTAVREQIAFQERQPDYKVGGDGTLFSIPKQSKDEKGNPVPSKATPVLGPDGQPMVVANPEKAQAIAKLVDVAKTDYVETLRRYEIDMKEAQNALKLASDSVGAKVDGDKDPGVVAAKKAVDDIKKKYNPEINSHRARIGQLQEQLGIKAGMATPGDDTPDLSGYLKGTNKAGGPR